MFYMKITISSAFSHYLEIQLTVTLSDEYSNSEIYFRHIIIFFRIFIYMIQRTITILK